MRLGAQSIGASILREEIAQLVVEDTGAGGLKEDDGKSRVDVRGHGFKDAHEVAAGSGQESEVVERASAAEMGSWKGHVEARSFEYVLCGGECVRMVVVVPGVGPQEYGFCSLRRWARWKALETTRGEP